MNEIKRLMNQNLTYNYLQEIMTLNNSKQYEQWSGYDMVAGRFAQLILDWKSVILKSFHLILFEEFEYIMDLIFNDLDPKAYIQINNDALLYSSVVNYNLIVFNGEVKHSENRILIKDIKGLNADNFRALLIELLIIVTFNKTDFTLHFGTTKGLFNPTTKIVNLLNIWYAIIWTYEDTHITAMVLRNQLYKAFSNLMSLQYLNPYSYITMQYRLQSDNTIYFQSIKTFSCIADKRFSPVFLYNNLISGWTNILFKFTNLVFNMANETFWNNQLLDFIIYSSNNELISKKNNNVFNSNFWKCIKFIHKEKDIVMNLITKYENLYENVISDTKVLVEIREELCEIFTEQKESLNRIPFNRFTLMFFSTELTKMYIDTWYQELYFTEDDFLRIYKLLNDKKGTFAELDLFNNTLKSEYSWKNILEYFKHNTESNNVANCNHQYSKHFHEVGILHEK